MSSTTLTKLLANCGNVKDLHEVAMMALRELERLEAICGDCKAPVSFGPHYRCWWCKVSFCQDCAPKHFGSPEENKPGALAERIGNAICDERARILRLIQDEQAFLTVGDKKLLEERLIDSWSRRS